MLLIKLFSFMVFALQTPPSPKNGPNPPPPGLVVPIDDNIWILLVIAIALIVYVVRRRIIKTA